MIQYYFSQPSVVTAWKAPNNRLFESQSGQISNRTYVDLAKNYTKEISTFMKDFYSVRHWFVNGQKDYISYYKAARNWIENELSFVESDAFRKAKLDVILHSFRILSSMEKWWDTERQLSKWHTHKSSHRVITFFMTKPPLFTIFLPVGLGPLLMKKIKTLGLNDLDRKLAIK